jgi:uncharacterized phosphatase
MRIFLIRHGETDWNLEGRLQGREDIPLNETGILQADICGQAFRGMNIGAIITSPLARASKTAEIIAGHVGINELIIDDRLIERDFGELSGAAYDRRKYFDTFGIDTGIEPYDTLQKRLMDCIKDRAINMPDACNMIMVSHGGAINAVISALTGGEAGSGRTRLKNACISIICCSEGNPELDSYNLSAEEFKEYRSINGI